MTEKTELDRIMEKEISLEDRIALYEEAAKKRDAEERKDTELMLEITSEIVKGDLVYLEDNGELSIEALEEIGVYILGKMRYLKNRRG